MLTTRRLTCQECRSVRDPQQLLRGTALVDAQFTGGGPPRMPRLGQRTRMLDAFTTGLPRERDAVVRKAGPGRGRCGVTEETHPPPLLQGAIRDLPPPTAA